MKEWLRIAQQLGEFHPQRWPSMIVETNQVQHLRIVSGNEQSQVEFQAVLRISLYISRCCEHVPH